ncbi:MAG: hypothetical protein LAP87_17805 [Acidobacteriia bacterium]|nr:hypothetical protein [Terriglobia bacterium]
MCSSAPPSSLLRQVLDDRFSQTAGEVERLFGEACLATRSEYAGRLNQAVRRMRLADSAEELGATLLDAAAAFSGNAALFRVEGETVRGEGIRGVPEQAAEAFRTLAIPLPAAAALAHAVESRDPVVAITTAAEVSAEMMDVAGHSAEGRVSVFPVVAADRVVALVYAWGDVQTSAVELLAQVAGAVWPAGKAVAGPLVTIEPAIQPAPAASAWDRLSPEDQQVHLRAQRFARVKVSEMHLAESGAVHAGRVRGDLYATLGARIDAARAAFRQSFFAACPSMVDYLHLELVRNLAHDDPELLGKDYPGPLA